MVFLTLNEFEDKTNRHVFDEFLNLSTIVLDKFKMPSEFNS
jgi:hypothetical protein